jgi:hypothetical protein
MCPYVWRRPAMNLVEIDDVLHQSRKATLAADANARRQQIAAELERYYARQKQSPRKIPRDA